MNDHDHLSGKFRGAAHNSCNLNYRINPSKYKVPIFFHNLKHYDAHLIFQEVIPKQHGQIKAIPKTGEQYISFTVGDMVFKDSYAFMSSSLADLVASSKTTDLLHTRQFIQDDLLSPAFDIIDASVIIEESTQNSGAKPDETVVQSNHSDEKPDESFVQSNHSGEKFSKGTHSGEKPTES